LAPPVIGNLHRELGNAPPHLGEAHAGRVIRLQPVDPGVQHFPPHRFIVPLGAENLRFYFNAPGMESIKPKRGRSWSHQSIAALVATA
jgi:hypothetical protein